MINVEVEFKINQKELRRIIVPAMKEASKAGMQTLKEIAEEFTPMKTGFLRKGTKVIEPIETSELVIESGIENGVKYALELEEVEKANYTTEGTGSKYFKKASIIGRKEVVKDFSEKFQKFVEMMK